MLKKLSLAAGILALIGSGFWFWNIDSSLHAFITKSQVSPSQSTPILSELDTSKLAFIEIQGHEEKVVLHKNEKDQWQVTTLDYEADSEKIQKLLVKFLQTKLGDQVTDKITYHERFHLLHADENEGKWEKDKTGVLVTLKTKEDTSLLQLLIGKHRNRGGRYIRYAGQPEVYMISESFWIDQENEDWLDKQLVDVDGKELVKSIDIQHAPNPNIVSGLESFLEDDESTDWLSKKWVDPQEKKNMEPQNTQQVVHMERANKDAAWDLQGISQKETPDQSKLKDLANVLNNLEFDKLPPKDWSEEQMGRGELAYFTAELFDGRVIHLNLGTQPASDKEDDYYMKLRMSLKDGVEDEVLKSQVEVFNQKVQSHIYGVRSWIGKKFLKTQSDLIKEKEEKEAA